MRNGLVCLHCLKPELTATQQSWAANRAFRGTRICVEFILELIASGATTDDILKAYHQLTAEDVAAAVEFAAEFDGIMARLSHADSGGKFTREEMNERRPRR